MKFEDMDAIAATEKPGLVGCLLVGVNAAKTLSLVYNKPFIPVNHLKAHVCANYIDTDLKPPFLCLLVSGGHTQLIKVSDYGQEEIIGQIIGLLNARIRPAVKQDGGDIVFKSFEDGIVYVEMKGNCAGCPYALVTLKEGVEKILKTYIPQVKEVRSFEKEKENSH